MAKQQMYQRYIFKIHSKDIIRQHYNYNLTSGEARQNNDLITLADSQVLRFIDEINCVDRQANQLEYDSLVRELRRIRKESKSCDSKRRTREIYSQLESIQLVEDYIDVVIDNPNDIFKLQGGFTFNGKTFKRLVGTSNGVKKSVVVYTSLWDELDKRLNCGRDVTKELVPAKFESYKGLTCSASIPLSEPNGVIVVPDLELEFMSHVIELKDADDNSEPLIAERDMKVGLNANDGFGLMSPKLAQQWSDDLHLDYLMSGCCIRNAFVKGMSFTFDFHKFAKEIAHNDIVVDVWGNSHNINDINLILTASMFKLWDSYKDYNEYSEYYHMYNYSYATTKATPKKLDNQRSLNYQFIQSYQLTDEEIAELIRPTVDEIKSVLHTDVGKSILFLRGESITEENVLNDLPNGHVKALMIDDRMINDPYVIDMINAAIKKKINNTKIGVIGVHGNYQILSGDPYALCEHMFGMINDTSKCGLLGSGEAYSKYWVDEKVDKIVCFRAPMSCHNNIRAMTAVDNEQVNEWYKYMDKVFIVNAHDTFTHALNGADNDGDLVFSTNNSILVNKLRDVPAIVCVQKKAAKQVIDEDALVLSNTNGFGNDIGAITNRVTAMYDLQATYDTESEEYKVLDYRIKCGQLLQQNCIDAIKGIISNPMPKYWYQQNKDLSDFNKRICVNKKPYFMIYIYPEQMTRYKAFVKWTNVCGVFDFKKTIVELESKDILTTNEQDFLNRYYKYYPVLDNSSTMNRLCHMVENVFDGYVCRLKKSKMFDYSILKSDVEYSRKDYNEIKKIWLQYQHEMRDLKPEMHNKEGREEYARQCQMIEQRYIQLCRSVCVNEDELCNIVLDLCYTTGKSKAFAWKISGDTIIKNLLAKNDNQIRFLEKNDNGNVLYKGESFSWNSKRMGDVG